MTARAKAHADGSQAEACATLVAMPNFDLTTQRLSLRPFTAANVDELHRHWTNADVRKYLWDDEIIPRETAAEVVTASLASFTEHGFGFWLMTLVESDEFAGFCGLRHFGEEPLVEILYGIEPALWGSGLAVEASQAVLQFGFEQAGLAKIYAGADPPNAASIRVMEKLGMRSDHRRTINGLEAIYYALERPTL
jgi:RimJ/RimL family protein N-acetyltransferase